MEIILKKLFKTKLLVLVLLAKVLYPQELEIAGKEEINIYMELLKTSGENLFIPSPEDLETLFQNYLSELYQSQQQLSEFYKILKTLGYIDDKNIMEMELRTYKEHFFERKEMEIFSEHLRIEWEGSNPKWIIFRSKSSMEPKLNVRNTIFILPAVKMGDSQHQLEKKYIKPSLQVIANLSYSAGMGEKYNFYLPGEDTENFKYKNNIQIFDYIIKDVPPRIIDDPRLKILTLQYIVYRMRYLDIKIRSIIKNKLRKNISDFYKSIPDTRY
ncbi:MAG: hypothetical protein ACK4UJ_03910 [Leptonema sp. (in: bacteria)]